MPGKPRLHRLLQQQVSSVGKLVDDEQRVREAEKGAWGMVSGLMYRKPGIQKTLEIRVFATIHQKQGTENGARTRACPTSSRCLLVFKRRVQCSVISSCYR
ncbi:hypothetical protein PM082_000365 [Marasmius tenuissimus]|nr:hypothetical protein PM082_000365 [Marasmius tenuissimus]